MKSTKCMAIGNNHRSVAGFRRPPETHAVFDREWGGPHVTDEVRHFQQLAENLRRYLTPRYVPQRMDLI